MEIGYLEHKKRGLFKEMLFYMRHGLDKPYIKLEASPPEHQKELREAIQSLFSNEGKRGLTEWDVIKPKDKAKILDRLYNETIYKALSSYDGDSRKLVARELWHFASDFGSLDEPTIKLIAFAELMGERLITDICKKNGPEFTRAFIHIYNSEYTSLMLFDHVMADATDRVAYAAAKAIGSREGEAAKVRLRTVLNCIDNMGNDSNLFSGNFAYVIDEAKRVLGEFMREDEFNSKNATEIKTVPTGSQIDK